MSADKPLVLSSVVPGAKRSDGEPSQDAVASCFPSEDTAIVALADGAGSAKHGGYGAQLAVVAATESLEESLGRQLPLEEALKDAFHDARRTLFAVSRASDRDSTRMHLDDLATTLSLAVFGPMRVAIASVGDGVHILRDHRGYLELVAMAPDTEIANHTDFITGPDLDDKIVIAMRPAQKVESLLLSSDGLDSYLVGRRDGDRWPLTTIVNSLLNAPVLDSWGEPQFESLLTSEVIQRHSDDDCSLALIRRPLRAGAGSTQVAGLTLTPTGELPTGRRAWSVGGCSSLIAVQVDSQVPTDAGIAARSDQIWDRAQRQPPVNWPIRRIGDNLVLLPCPLSGARAVRPILDRSRRGGRMRILAEIRRCVEAMHETGVSHGKLTVECFALYPDGDIALCDPGPGMFDGVDRKACLRLDVEFLDRLEKKAEPGRRGKGRGPTLRRGRSAPWLRRRRGRRS